MMYLDLAELPEIFSKRWLWSATRPALARFHRCNHLGPIEQPLNEAVRDLVEQESGRRPEGPIRLLTNLSYFGFCFNPVSYYYCFAQDGVTVDAIVAEVTNTPWGERDTYVLPRSAANFRGSAICFRDKKKMHVSPFMPMNMQYDWRFELPNEGLRLFMANSMENRRLFSASLALRRTHISTVSLARVLVVYPLLTFKIMFAIHWQALRLWIKGCPVYAHPDKQRKVAATHQQ